MAAAPGGQPLVELDRAHLLERVDHRVAVRAEGEPGARVAQPQGQAGPVAEVALGGGAEAGVRRRPAERRDVPSGEVRGVDDRGAGAERAGHVEHLGRGGAVRREARLVLGDLLGEVHVQRGLVRLRPRRDHADLRPRHGPHRVHRGAEHHLVVLDVLEPLPAGSPRRSRRRR